MTDIFDRLKKDHDKHRELLTKIAATESDDDKRDELFQEFKLDAKAHAAAEEETLYAEMLKDPDLREEGSHSTAEHKEIEDLLTDLQKTPRASSGWKSKFEQLDNLYRHHINEEEEDTFKMAEDKFTKAKRESLGKTFDERKPAEKEKLQEDEKED